MINMMVAMKIAQYYPNRTVMMAVYDTDLQKYAASIMKYYKGLVGDTLYCTDRYEYDTQEEAILNLNQQVDEAMRMIEIMSN